MLVRLEIMILMNLKKEKKSNSVLKWILKGINSEPKMSYFLMQIRIITLLLL